MSVSKVQGEEVVVRMRSIEDNIEYEVDAPSPPLDLCVATLLGIEYEGLDRVLSTEAEYVVELARGWYAAHGNALTPTNVAALGFVQGITFAIAAQRLKDER